VRRSVLARVLTLAALFAAVGCGGYRTVERRLPAGPGWPADQPRVRLDSIVELDGKSGSGSSRFLRWLGEEDSATLRRFRRPYGVTWMGEQVIVADPDARRVARIAPRGRIAFSNDGLFRRPVGVAACLGGLVVSDAESGRVALLDAELELVRWLARDLERPTGIACAGQVVHVVETGRHRLLALDGEGGTKAIGGRGAEPGRFNFPTALAVDGAELLVGDTLNFRVQRIERFTGTFLDAFGRLGDAPGEMPRIKSVAVDRAGQVWVSDAHLDRVSLYDREGQLLVSIGRSGSGVGEFSFPAGIAAHADGRVAVVDSLNRRLQIFRVAGETPSPTGAMR